LPKLYQSKTWLQREYWTKRKTVEQIAKEQGVTIMTIYRYLEKFGLRK
jgi:transposase